MSTSNAQEKLDYIAGTKTAIKDAIELKGVVVGAETFRNYATKIAEIAAPQDAIVREYDADATWTKPAGLKSVVVVCVGAGGGGGSGRRGASGTLRRGGGGGGAPSIVTRHMLAAELGTSESIVIGVGGGGGAAVTTDDTSGNSGVKGGNTSFGSLVIAEGGDFGIRGGDTNATTDGNGGATLFVTGSTPGQIVHVRLGRNGAASSTIGGNGGAGVISVFSSSDQSGAPAGGGKPTSDASSTGGSSVRMFNISNVQSPSIPGGAPNQDGGIGASNYGNQLLFQYSTTPLITKCIGIPGTGGGAGDNTPTAAGAGGAGGLYGAAGAGGGASLNGANSGAGGAGSSGLCIIMEIY